MTDRVFTSSFQLAGQVMDRANVQSVDRRYLVGVAGPPGGGKSTLAIKLRDIINVISGRQLAEVAPMDGFHKSNIELARLAMVSKKGEPPTFDVDKFLHALIALREGSDAQVWPTYDRKLHDPTPDGAIFGKETRIAVVEGNYLLYDREPWAQVRSVLNECWYLDAESEVIYSRLLQRQIDGGKSEIEARRKVELSDLANVKIVRETRPLANLILQEDSGNYYVLKPYTPLAQS